ncbi:MAG: extracellular solute-binding protein [Clostridia bacterium]|nr:extracellular solute-binding protein [Clostridia bacterium]
MKKFIAIALCVAMCFALTACGGNKDNNADQNGITVWGAADDQNMLGEMVKSFKTKFTDITNDITVKVTGEDKAKDEALKDIDAAADVFAMSHDQLGAMVDAGAIYEITGDYADTIRQTCDEASVKAATYKGKLYGFPSSAETYFLYYDKSKLSADDVKSLNTIFSKPQGEGVYKIGMNFKEGYYGTSLFFTAGCTLFGENGDDPTKCDFNNENGVMASKFIASLKSKGAINCDDNEAVSQMKAGKLASFVTGPWKAEAIKEILGDNYGVAKLPTVSLGEGQEQKQLRSFAGYKIYVVNAKTKSPAQSMKLAAHLTSEENQLKRFKDRSLLPVNKNAAKNESVTSDVTVRATLEQLKYAIPMPAITQISKYWTAFKAFADDCFNGNIPADQIKPKLDNMVKQITAQ